MALPARLFTTQRDCVDRHTYTDECFEYAYGTSVRLNEREVTDLKKRILVVYGSAAVVVVLLGLAFGAARRSTHRT